MYGFIRRRSHIFFSVVGFSALLLTFLFFPTQNPGKPSKPLHVHRHLELAKSTCQGTLYHDLCVSTLTSFPDLTSKSIPQIIAAAVNQTVRVVQQSASNCSGIRHNLLKLSVRQQRALDDCLQLFDDTVGQLEACISDLSPKNASKRFHDLQTLLSASITNQDTCLDGLSYDNHDHQVRNLIIARLERVKKMVSNSLAMLKKLPARNAAKPTPKTEEAFPEYGEMVNGFPSWMSEKDRRLLKTSVNVTKIDLVVARDGTGNYTTITEAVEAAPNNTKQTFVIHIKAGLYLEYVNVVRKKTNLMLIGDGIGKTIIKGNRNIVDGWTTFRSATVAVAGEGFIMRDITVENSAGPDKHQAVAFRSSADFSACYRCSFVGYQDTLYVHSLRQFYRDCDVYGTVDFVFGDASVVLQNCNLYSRKPNPNQKNIVTAQGREYPNQNTGISIQTCKIAAAADLIPVKSSYKTYLGRPWKQYSRTVIMYSYIDDAIDPAGWLEWAGDFALSTLYYGEYMNRGPGANTTNRVKWPGYRVINSSVEANQFTVEPFIQGREWLTLTSIPVIYGLG
ncbi:pectinesterase-like [Aristolochia californica]|uniref:pectinesterase-like n=1 Tax=Aristolochia californica TaxID=171875 RepID=UPI0035D93969